MSETYNDSHVQSPTTSEPAKWSLGLGLISLLCLISFVFVPNEISAIGLVGSIALAVILGVIGILQINRSNGRVKGTGLAIWGIAFHLILAVAVICGILHIRKVASRVFCETQISGLGKVLKMYAQQHDGQYATPSRWCDVLIEDKLTLKTQFCCKEATVRGDRQPCHYAMNPNCGPDSPPDMVLLFETKGGWNQHGGPEILTTENHGGKGCHVLFNDGTVRFVLTEDLDQLKWKKLSE